MEQTKRRDTILEGNRSPYRLNQRPPERLLLSRLVEVAGIRLAASSASDLYAASIQTTALYDLNSRNGAQNTVTPHALLSPPLTADSPACPTSPSPFAPAILSFDSVAGKRLDEAPVDLDAREACPPRLELSSSAHHARTSQPAIRSAVTVNTSSSRTADIGRRTGNLQRRGIARRSGSVRDCAVVDRTAVGQEPESDRQPREVQAAAGPL